jgi:hypothetical protein
MMSQHATVFHPLSGYGLCHGAGWEPVQEGITGPPNATLVHCRLCGRYGVIPDEGHELEFLPPGTERGPGGEFIMKFPRPERG